MSRAVRSFAEIERLLLAASGFNPAANTPASARPRLGGISFLHRFGSALNHHVHLRDSSDRRCLPAGCRSSRQGRTADVPAGPASHRRRLGRTDRASPPPRDPMVPARSPARRRGRRRHARLGEQRVFHRRFSCGSHSSTATCRAISRVLSIFSDTAPAPPSHSSDSP